MTLNHSNTFIKYIAFDIEHFVNVFSLLYYTKTLGTVTFNSYYNHMLNLSQIPSGTALLSVLLLE